MATTTTHFESGKQGAAACGRHKDRGRRYVARIATSSNVHAVDCAACERTAAYRAAAPAAPKSERPAPGTRVKVWGLEAVVIAPGFCTAAAETRIQWDTPNHKDHGRKVDAMSEDLTVIG